MDFSDPAAATQSLLHSASGRPTLLDSTYHSVSTLQLVPVTDPAWVKMLAGADLSTVEVGLGDPVLAWDAVSPAPDDIQKARLRDSAITGTEDDHLRSALAQARIRLESLQLLYDFVDAVSADRIIDQVLVRLEQRFKLGPFDRHPVTLSIDALRGCRDLPRYVEGLIKQECQLEARRQRQAGQAVNDFPKPTVLAAWWRQRRNYLLKIGANLDAEETHVQINALNAFCRKLYACENAAIFAGGRLVSHKYYFSTDRSQPITCTERLVELTGGKTAVIANYFPVEPGWLLTEQIDQFVGIYQSVAMRTEGASDIAAITNALVAIKGDHAGAALPRFFWARSFAL